jgi:hypothetical protein
MDKFIQEFKTNDSITYNVLDEIYKSRGMNNFRNVVELNFVNIFAICSKLDLTMLEAALVGGYH